VPLGNARRNPHIHAVQIHGCLCLACHFLVERHCFTWLLLELRTGGQLSSQLLCAPSFRAYFSPAFYRERKRKIKGERGRKELWTYKEKSREREKVGKAQCLCFLFSFHGTVNSHLSLWHGQKKNNRTLCCLVTHFSKRLFPYSPQVDW